MNRQIKTLRSLHSTAFNLKRNCVLVDGARTPFCRANQEFDGIWSYDLQSTAISGLLKRNPSLNTEEIERVVCGTTIHEANTSNVAREAATAAGVPFTTPCNTVTLACISSNVAVNQVVTSIENGDIDIGIAGGTESTSDMPLRHPRKTREWVIKHGQRVNGLTGKKGLLQALDKYQSKSKTRVGKMFDMLGMDVPGITEFSTGETMGHFSDRLTAAFGVSREEQDEFAYKSHLNALNAQQAGHFTDVLKVFVPGRDSPVDRDMGVKPNLEKARTLKPAFVKPHGTATAANSSFLTDGASACLLMAEDVALEKGFKPLAYIRESVVISRNPADELLLGPAYSASAVLLKSGIKFEDIGAWELHEAFSGQVLSCIKALSNDEFCSQHMPGRHSKVGEIPMDTVNQWGGSLSIGHPFGATGVRLVTQTALRLQHSGERYGLIAACAAGGHAFGGIIERYPN